MRRLKVSRFLQDPAHCSVGACAMTANFYNKEINYKNTKELATQKVSKDISKEGLDSAQMCLLLNLLGFRKVILVSSDFDVWDYEWKNYGRRKIIEKLEESISLKKDKEEKALTKNILKWYSRKGCQNEVKIDYDFSKYIRKFLNRKKPVVLTFNWTMFFKFKKEGEKGPDDINGNYEEHAVVANGYDDNGVWIVDSHHKYYKYNRKKYRRGFYKIKWEHLLSCMGQGDVIFPEDYDYEHTI